MAKEFANSVLQLDEIKKIQDFITAVCKEWWNNVYNNVYYDEKQIDCFAVSCIVKLVCCLFIMAVLIWKLNFVYLLNFRPKGFNPTNKKKAYLWNY